MLDEHEIMLASLSDAQLIILCNIKKKNKGAERYQALPKTFSYRKAGLKWLDFTPCWVYNIY